MGSDFHSGKTVSEAREKKIHVSELQIGMYVSKLDRDWLETPFLMQGFKVQNLQDIEAVSKYCEHVWIDAVQDTYIAASDKATLTPQRKKKRYVNKVGASDEHKRAVGVVGQARRVTKTLLDEARLGASIDTEQAKATVNDCVQSILRNPDAMLWLSKIRHEDEYTAEHCLNVCILCIAFGRHLGMEEEDLQKLGLCGLLHDVGKMKVPPDVLNKPGKLTDKEFKMVKAHSIHGRNMLMRSPGIYQGVVDVAYAHHERMDGGGYPRGIKASGISDFSRMVAIVDAYDAMTAKRCYDDARPSTEALKEIYRCRGAHFDERLASEFTEMVGLYPPGSIVELVNGCVGIVLNTNHRYRHLPRVLIVRDENKHSGAEKVVNLNDTERGRLPKEFLIQQVHVDGAFAVRLQDYKAKGLQLSFD